MSDPFTPVRPVAADDEMRELVAVVGRLEDGSADLGIRDREVAQILGLPPGDWPMSPRARWAPMPCLLEKRLRDLEESCRLLWQAFGPEAVPWLRDAMRPGSATPIDALSTDPYALGALRDALRSCARSARPWIRHAR